MATVLSTKKLALNQKELLLNSGIGLVEYDAISIIFHALNFKTKKIENAIFTSKNALKSICKEEIAIENCFCVGEKTSAFARSCGMNVKESANNAKELALKITEQHSNKEFHFFSGNKRRDELPEILKENNINYKETQVYKTELNTKRFHSDFDGILFFSPSGVQSFTVDNILNTSAFCIGETTANEALKHTENVIVASKPSIENVITKVVSKFKNEKNTSGYDQK
ncbi:uroporphyrinogen-III synthase [Gramella lutea]|uniref:Uroporphyrinogen-III synthase n=1 Tax=Christiangramia lutea TaxID=1607951 RepID=A0A9X1V1Z8_9FLAO|nr:uroporphyrinogen-III synthase [Christiangramia lutea]MCH4822556.1 uroporphyrinogen-III synthase [Christiangramia lutea]